MIVEEKTPKTLQIDLEHAERIRARLREELDGADKTVAVLRAQLAAASKTPGQNSAQANIKARPDRGAVNVFGYFLKHHDIPPEELCEQLQTRYAAVLDTYLMNERDAAYAAGKSETVEAEVQAERISIIREIDRIASGYSDGSSIGRIVTAIRARSTKDSSSL